MRYTQTNLHPIQDTVKGLVDGPHVALYFEREERRGEERRGEERRKTMTYTGHA